MTAPDLFSFFGAPEAATIADEFSLAGWPDAQEPPEFLDWTDWAPPQSVGSSKAEIDVARFAMKDLADWYYAIWQADRMLTDGPPGHMTAEAWGALFADFPAYRARYVRGYDAQLDIIRRTWGDGAAAFEENASWRTVRDHPHMETTPCP